MTGVWLGGTGLVDAETLRLFVIGLPLPAGGNLGRAPALCSA